MSPREPPPLPARPRRSSVSSPWISRSQERPARPPRREQAPAKHNESQPVTCGCADPGGRGGQAGRGGGPSAPGPPRYLHGHPQPALPPADSCGAPPRVKGRASPLAPPPRLQGRGPAALPLPPREVAPRALRLAPGPAREGACRVVSDPWAGPGAPLGQWGPRPLLGGSGTVGPRALRRPP